MAIYSGKDVVILTNSNNDIYDFVSESLQKFIQQRYSLISYNVYDIEDWQYVEDTMFNIRGVYVLDMDKERFSYLYMKMNMQSQGQY